MHFRKNLCLVVLLAVSNINAFPQSASEIAIGTKLTEQIYYNSGAPDLIPFDNPNHIDNAKEEYEGYGSKIDSIYDGLQKKSSKIFNPQPIVDGLKEAEKYGNKGDHLSGLNSIVVSVMSVVSNLVNKIVDAPVNVVTSLLQSTNKVLNQIGGKVVGLQK